jgi:hypothetical protein
LSPLLRSPQHGDGSQLLQSQASLKVFRTELDDGAEPPSAARV